MRWHTDHYFAIGATHLSSGKPCQDHSLSGSKDDLACAVIADGCSSGGHTDVGARILTLSTMQAMRDIVSIDYVARAQQRILSSAQVLLGLDKADLQATCAYACLTPDEGAVIHVQGDGTAAIKRRDGSIVAHHFEWANNAPFYPCYSALGEDWLFFAYQGARYAIAHPEVLPPEILTDCRQYVDTSRLDGIRRNSIDLMVSVGRRYPTLTVDVWSTMFGPDEKEDDLQLSVRGEIGVCGYVIRLSPEELADVALIAVFSDGVSQVENVGWREVVAKFLDIKVLRGEFVKRGMMFGIKWMKTKGRGPMDDVSAAMICVEES